MNKININVPRLNANDDDVEVIDIYINNGEQIKKGQKLFTFETTKTAIDFNSEYNGIINRISIKKGEFVKVGDLIGIVTTDKKILDQKKTKEVKFKNRSLNNSKKKITAKALKLLKENNLDLDEIESFNDKITTENIINYLNKKKIKVNISKKSFIIGCGGHALTVADIV
jgi:pyruvate/2-oxoglutarate dehydrogenase complex dihydrolipoamide acyltransferase (E2) component